MGLQSSGALNGDGNVLTQQSSETVGNKASVSEQRPGGADGAVAG